MKNFGLFQQIILAVLLTAFLVLFLLLMHIRANKNWIRWAQRKVLLENSGITSLEAFSAFYSLNPRRLRNPFRGKEIGIIIIKDDMVEFKGYKPKNTPIYLCFPMGELEAAWLGQMRLKGFWHWFVIKHNNQNHYFTSDTGRYFSTNEAETREIFRTFRRAYKKC